MEEETLTSIMYVRLTKTEREQVRQLAREADRPESWIARQMIRASLARSFEVSV